MIVTEWRQFRALDLKRLKREMANPVIVDLRNIYRRDEMEALVLPRELALVDLDAGLDQRVDLAARPHQRAHLLAATAQRARQVAAGEAGGARDQDGHGFASSASRRAITCSDGGISRSALPR